MNTERLIREVERRLADLGGDALAEVLDALREEIAREKRRTDPSTTVEAERSRRLEAETLREILEAINRQARLNETIEEVLKQLSRIVVYDACSLALLETDGRFRIFAARGFPEEAGVVGQAFHDPLSDEILQNRWPISVTDALEDSRFAEVAGADAVRSWAGIPLLVEGDVIGLLSLERHRVEPFDDEDLHRAKAVAFSASAAIRKAQLLDQVRRYAALMERTVAVDQAVFARRPQVELARVILEGATHIGAYAAGLFVVREQEAPRVAAAVGDIFAQATGIEGARAPKALDSETAAWLPAEAVPALGRALGVTLPEQPLYLVPVATADRHVGTLALLDPNGESADDHLMEAYASRSATAYVYSAGGRS